MARQSILVIDDEVCWRNLLARVLCELGYAVRSAASCAEGVRLAELHKPGCIILDFHLKDGDAVSVCAALKASKDCATIPVIIFSSDPDAEITAYAECKAAYFVLKGISLVDGLPRVIKNVLSPTLPRSVI